MVGSHVAQSNIMLEVTAAGRYYTCNTAGAHGRHCMVFGHLQVYDISAEDGAKQSFEFVQSAQYWEVPISGQGPPENPVPAADGSTYQVCMHLCIMTPYMVAQGRLLWQGKAGPACCYLIMS